MRLISLSSIATHETFKAKSSVELCIFLYDLLLHSVPQSTKFKVEPLPTSLSTKIRVPKKPACTNNGQPQTCPPKLTGSFIDASNKFFKNLIYGFFEEFIPVSMTLWCKNIIRFELFLQGNSYGNRAIFVNFTRIRHKIYWSPTSL